MTQYERPHVVLSSLCHPSHCLSVKLLDDGTKNKAGNIGQLILKLLQQFLMNLLLLYHLKLVFVRIYIYRNHTSWLLAKIQQLSQGNVYAHRNEDRVLCNQTRNLLRIDYLHGPKVDQHGPNHEEGATSDVFPTAVEFNLHQQLLIHFYIAIIQSLK